MKNNFLVKQQQHNLLLSFVPSDVHREEKQGYFIIIICWFILKIRFLPFLDAPTVKIKQSLAKKHIYCGGETLNPESVITEECLANLQNFILNSCQDPQEDTKCVTSWALV